MRNGASVGFEESSEKIRLCNDDVLQIKELIIVTIPFVVVKAERERERERES